MNKKIILPIKPEYVESILTGAKKFEFRTRLASDNVDAIFIYSTSPICKVIGKVDVLGKISESPNKMWEKTKNYAGISRSQFIKYFYGREIAFAYVLGDVKKYDMPKDIAEFGLRLAPQSFAYVNDLDEAI